MYCGTERACDGCEITAENASPDVLIKMSDVAQVMLSTSDALQDIPELGISVVSEALKELEETDGVTQSNTVATMRSTARIALGNCVPNSEIQELEDVDGNVNTPIIKRLFSKLNR